MHLIHSPAGALKTPAIKIKQIRRVNARFVTSASRSGNVAPMIPAAPGRTTKARRDRDHFLPALASAASMAGARMVLTAKIEPLRL
jgi:N-formylglutamate amidohydrolase